MLINASREFQVQIDGTVLAPSKVGSWPKSGLFQWINFKWLHNFTIQGSGTVDGQGSNWWSSTTTAASQSKHIKVSIHHSNFFFIKILQKHMLQLANLSVMYLRLAKEVKAHSRYQTHSKIHLISSYILARAKYIYLSVTYCSRLSRFCSP